MIGRQLPFFALILPFYALIFFTGIRSLRTAWAIALVAGVSFGLTQFVVTNYINYQLTDISLQYRLPAGSRAAHPALCAGLRLV